MAENNVLKPPRRCATLDPELRADLERIEAQLIPLLISVQKALGKEPSVQTRAQRRAQASN